MENCLKNKLDLENLDSGIISGSSGPSVSAHAAQAGKGLGLMKGSACGPALHAYLHTQAFSTHLPSLLLPAAREGRRMLVSCQD